MESLTTFEKYCTRQNSKRVATYSYISSAHSSNSSDNLPIVYPARPTRPLRQGGDLHPRLEVRRIEGPLLTASPGQGARCRGSVTIADTPPHTSTIVAPHKLRHPGIIGWSYDCRCWVSGFSGQLSRDNGVRQFLCWFFPLPERVAAQGSTPPAPSPPPCSPPTP